MKGGGPGRRGVAGVTDIINNSYRTAARVLCRSVKEGNSSYLLSTMMASF